LLLSLRGICALLSEYRENKTLKRAAHFQALIKSLYDELNCPASGAGIKAHPSEDGEASLEIA
jgi:hypothetical protein